MTTKINQPSIGLNSLLGTQAFGDNPNLLDQLASPTIDLLPFLGQQLIRSQRTTASRALAGQAIVVTIPAGEAWIPIQLGAGVFYNVLDAAAAVNYNLSIRIRPNIFASGSFITVASIIGTVQEVVAGGSLGLQFAWSPPMPIVLGPGSTLLVYCDQVDSVQSQSYELNYMYYRLNV